MNSSADDKLECAPERSDATVVAVAAISFSTIVLAVIYQNPVKFSDWGFGDAQTMMSVMNWAKDGILHYYGLFVPQGPSPVTWLLDLPELRHHAHGIAPDSTPGIGTLVGPRLLYTHYPSGYLWLYYAAYEVGLRTAPELHRVSLALSGGAAIFLFLAVRQWVGAWPAAMAAFFYVLSPGFVDYSATLANQPLDDFLRCLLIYLVVSLDDDARRQQRWWRYFVIPTIYFLLCSSSYDSTFFIFAFIVLYESVLLGRWRWGWWTFLAAIPLAAYGLQLVQNAAYLGWADAVLDQKLTFLGRGQGTLDPAVSIDVRWIAGRFIVNVAKDAVIKLSSCFFESRALLLVATVAALGSIVWLRQWRWLGLLFVLFVSGMTFSMMLLNASSDLDYQYRQLLPFSALLVAIASKGMLEISANGLARYRKHLDGSFENWGRLFNSKQGRWIVAVLTASAMCSVIWFRYSKDFAVTPNSSQQVAFAIKNMPTRYSKIVFSLHGFSDENAQWDYVAGYPQVYPELEYLSGGLILMFEDEEALVRDLRLLRQLSRERFSPILLTQNRGAAENIIRRAGTDRCLPSASDAIYGTYVTDLTACWEEARE